MNELKKILEFRSLIARLGEKDLFGWWDSETLTSAGRVVLSRLFPKTGTYAGIELSIEAARLTHVALLSELKAVSLFGLTQLFEKNIASYLYQCKMKDFHKVGPDNGIENAFDVRFINEINVQPYAGHISDISLILASSGLIAEKMIKEIAPKKKSVTGRLVCIGELSPKQEPTTEEYLHYTERLAAAYLFCSPGQLVVPYYLIKRL